MLLTFLRNHENLSVTWFNDWYLNNYSKIVNSLLIGTLLCLLLFVVSYFLSFSSQKEYEKGSEYECGFDPFDNATRQPFEVHFYIVGILFLILDVEIALLFPWAAGLSAVGPQGFWGIVILLLVLTIGFVYEWKRGALSWPHPHQIVKRYPNRTHEPKKTWDYTNFFFYSANGRPLRVTYTLFPVRKNLYYIPVGKIRSSH